MYKKYTICTTIIIFSVFFLVFSLNYIVDPFNINNENLLKLPKDKISYKVNYRLYKMSEFFHNPHDFIILGDSRSDALKSHYFNQPVYNFSYGGGNLSEVIDTFWFATKHVKLKRVIIGVPFNMFNGFHNSTKLTEEANLLIETPLKYYLNFLTVKVSWMNLSSKYMDVDFDLEKPSMTKEDFWLQQLNVTTKLFYDKYHYPKEMLLELEKINAYARENDIKLQIFIPPVHFDLQLKINDYNLNDAYRNYKKELSRLFDVIDFDIDSSITRNKENFSDPYHFTPEIAKNIVDEIMNETEVFSHKR